MNTSHVLVQAFNKINESSLTQSVAQTLEILYSEHLKGQAWTEASKTQEPRSTDFQQSVEMGGGVGWGGFKSNQNVAGTPSFIYFLL